MAWTINTTYSLIVLDEGDTDWKSPPRITSLPLLGTSTTEDHVTGYTSPRRAVKVLIDSSDLYTLLRDAFENATTLSTLVDPTGSYTSVRIKAFDVRKYRAQNLWEGTITFERSSR